MEGSAWDFSLRTLPWLIVLCLVEVHGLEPKVATGPDLQGLSTVASAQGDEPFEHRLCFGFRGDWPQLNRRNASAIVTTIPAWLKGPVYGFN